MLDVGPAVPVPGSGRDADLAVFVDRVAAAGPDRPTARAHEYIRGAIAAGETPPGIRRLAEALATSAGGRPPRPRLPADGASTAAAALRGASLLVLQDFDAAAVAESVAALVAEGRRVVVTAEETGQLAALQAVLPLALADRVVDDLPALAPAEVGELRRLLVTSTAVRRSRARQRLPDAGLLPPAEEFTELCALVSRSRSGVADPADATVRSVMAGLDPARRSAVTSVALHVRRTLAGLPSRTEARWAWRLLADLIHSRHRAPFDQLREDTVQACAALERARTQPSVVVTGRLPAGSREVLGRYAEFLAGGGHSRPHLRRAAHHRDIAPVLRLLRVGGRAPEGLRDVARIVEHLELGARLARIDRGCHTVGLPAPRDEADLVGLTDGLSRVAAAARSVGALRHDVLFLAEGSPLAVPDVETAGQVAAAIIDYARHGVGVEAAQRLDRLVEVLLDRAPADTRAPERAAAVRAIELRDPPAYAAAVDALRAARRQQRDEQRQAELLGRLAVASPALAAAWERLAPTEPAGLGLICLRPAAALLGAVPPTDSADVVVVLGAHRLGIARLLLAAVAPRLVAVVPPDTEPRGGPTLLGVLERAAADVIQGRPAPVPPSSSTGSTGSIGSTRSIEQTVEIAHAVSTEHPTERAVSTERAGSAERAGSTERAGSIEQAESAARDGRVAPPPSLHPTPAPVPAGT